MDYSVRYKPYDVKSIEQIAILNDFNLLKNKHPKNDYVTSPANIKYYNCLDCGKVLSDKERFHGFSPRRCSDCKKIVERKQHQKYYDKRRKTIQHENCMMCGASLINTQTGKRRPKFCSVKCDQRFYWLSTKPQNKPKKCMICSKVFVGVKNKKYCSVYCYAQSLTAYWRHRREQKKLIKVVAR